MIRTLMMTGALALTAAAPAALAQPMSSPPPSSPAMSSHPMMTAMPTPDYVRTAAQSDEYEIAAARMALHHSTNPHVLAFAHKMITDHTKSTMMIKSALRASGHPVPPPPPLSSAQADMMASLRTAGPNFDHMYVDQQVKAHEMALQVHQAYADGGTDPALKHTAGEIVPVVQSHLAMARDMQSHMS